MRLINRTAVVTGGSDGIGLAIASAFVRNGADVLIIGRREERLEEARALLESTGSRRVHCIAADLSDPPAIDRAASVILDAFPQIDVLVNNAGAASFAPFETVGAHELDALIALNVKAPYLLSQRLVAALEPRRGSIINLSSYFSHRMIPGRPSTAYSLTKGAVDSFTRALACELGPRGVRVNAIAPGTVDTQLVRSALERMQPDARRRFEESIPAIYPLGHIGKPEDIAAMAVHLASDDARWVTGAVFNVDGGLTTN